MPITQAPHMAGTSHIEAHDAQRRRGSPPLLWIALIVAMFAAALLWLRTHNTAPTAAAPTSERMLPAAPAAAAERAVTSQPRATAPTQRAAAPVRDRQAQPLASNAKPDYPAIALRNGVQGSVVASLKVGVDGRVDEASIVSRSGERSRELDRAVLSAVNQWRFEPAMKDGKAVASVVRVPVDFRTAR
ncbi:energy transducer TonB [Stenotrophomonas sp. C3(2023)]|uniref:energy transducer TonB n=1 Tax=Stenotrophomonas sp. C3(2023) TaxID=3080277 RepID=UPI00293CBD87|nr:energy transducer TonB [Stenotrophomonas sp. C3(2023)]MDV3468418.1 energy transducer TonB [Stenotrophomonas sp. C3(2023)]